MTLIRRARWANFLKDKNFLGARGPLPGREEKRIGNPREGVNS